MKDRSHYRKCEDSLLFEEAKYNPNAELAIVLAERLEVAQAAFDDKIEQFIQSTFAKVDAFKVEIQGLAAELTEE
jgi:hypothetical protein